jgi:hypothetical protein
MSGYSSVDMRALKVDGKYLIMYMMLNENEWENSLNVD